MTLGKLDQGDLFAAHSFETLGSLLDATGCPRQFVIGCGKTKNKVAGVARSLYVSDRFRTARSLVEALGANYHILSALHGLLLPNSVVAPYDADLRTLSDDVQRQWAESAIEHLRAAVGGTPITVLANRAYTAPLIEWNARQAIPLNISAPLLEISESHHIDWLRRALALALRIRDLKLLYSMIEKARDQGQTFRLEALSKQKLPPRGVYIFLDFSERNFLGNAPRIVRIGTHAVSRGSKSTLKSRLRNHLGVLGQGGNHRGSIFRLHVGRAMLESEDATEHLGSWGLGQDAPMVTRADEDKHERSVSNYLRLLEVFILPIDDAPSKNSLRAAVETQLIALCSENLEVIDKPGPTWLGRCSPMTLIAHSGLWNLRDVGRRYDAAGRGSISDVMKTAGVEP